MRYSLTILPVLALGVSAQTTVQSLFFAAPSETNGYVGSVVGVNSGLTTYAVACTSGDSNCYTGTTVTITEGPTSIEVQTIVVTDGATASVDENCIVAGKTSATCTATASISAAGISTVTSLTTTIGTDEFHYHPVTITAGASLLSAGSAAGSGNAAPMITGLGMAGAAVMGLAALL